MTSSFFTEMLLFLVFLVFVAPGCVSAAQPDPYDIPEVEADFLVLPANEMSVSTDFAESLGANLIEACINPHWYESEVFVKSDPAAISLFKTYGDGDALAEVIVDLRSGEYSSSMIQQIVMQGVPAIVFIALGILLLIVAICWTCCLKRKCRKMIAKCFCKLCCSDRKRKPLWELANWKFIAGGILVGLAICFGLFGSLFIFATWAHQFLASYNAMECDMEQSFRGMIFEPAYSANVSGDLMKWKGTNYFYKEVDSMEQSLGSSEGSVPTQAFEQFALFKTGMEEVSVSIAADVTAATDFVDEVGQKITDIGADHYCYFCASSVALGEVSAGFDASATTATDSLETELDSSLGPTAAIFDQVADAVGAIKIPVEMLNEMLSGYYGDFHSFTSSGYKGAYGIYIAMVVTAILVLLITVQTLVGYVVMLTKRVFREDPATKLMKGCFAFNLGCLAIFGAICVLLAGILLLLLTYGSGGCDLIATKLLQEGRWEILLGNATTESVEDAEEGMDLTAILNQCVTAGGDGDLFAAMGLSDAVSEVSDALDDSLDSLSTSTSDAMDEVNRTSKATESMNSFVAVSWLVLPVVGSLASPQFPQIPMTGIQLYDVDIDCTSGGIEGSLCDSAPVTIYGLATLNDLLNSKGTDKWCMKSVKAADSSLCPAGAKVIDQSTDSSTGDVDAEHAAITISDDATTADTWRNAVDIAIQKEKILASNVFSCNGTACDAGEYMPYVTEANTTGSHFADDFSEYHNAITESTNKVDTLSNNFITAVVGGVQGSLSSIGNIATAANCAFIGFTFRQFANGMCDLLLPSLAVYPVGLFLFAASAFVLVPFSWATYHYIRDTIEFASSADSSPDNRSPRVSVYKPEEGVV